MVMEFAAAFDFMWFGLGHNGSASHTEYFVFCVVCFDRQRTVKFEGRFADLEQT